MGLLLVSERLVHGRMTKRLACVADYIPSAEPNAVEVRAVAAPQTGWATPQYPDLPAVEEHLNLGAQRFLPGFPRGQEVFGPEASTLQDKSRPAYIF